MMSEKMQPVVYQGAVWDGRAVHADLWDLLLQKDRLVEITFGEGPYEIVLGVPHHAAPGVNRIADDWSNPKNGQNGRPADETTGLAGLAAFETLRQDGISCKLVIASHATDHDPNKTPGSAYWQSVFQEPLPRLLLELHGAARHRRHALELSAGRNQITKPHLFGKMLAYYLDEKILLAVQLEPGSSEARIFKGRQGTNGRLQNPALETLSLTRAGELGIPALHLEMKSSFRQPESASAPAPPEPAWQLARALASVLKLRKRSEPVVISAAELGFPSTAFLTRPSMDYAASYLEAVKEADSTDLQNNPELRVWDEEDLASFVKFYQHVDFNPLPDSPPEEYLWLIDQGEFVGRLFHLHWLNEYRLKNDGQVDYWIRPSRRQQGYGRLILRLTLAYYRRLGLERILITCREDNTGSRKIIESCGGVYESSIEDYDIFRPGLRRRYWIDIK